MSDALLPQGESRKVMTQGVVALEKAVKFFCDHVKNQPQEKPKVISDAVEELLAVWKSERKDRLYISNAGGILRRFAAAHPGVLVSTLTAGNIQTWLLRQRARLAPERGSAPRLGEMGSAAEAQEYFARNKKQMIGITALLVRRCPQYATIGDLFSDIYVQLGRPTIIPVKFPGLVYRIGYRLLGERMKRAREHVILSLQAPGIWTESDSLEFLIPDSKQKMPYEALSREEEMASIRKLINVVEEKLPSDQFLVLRLLSRCVESGCHPKQKEIMEETGFSQYTVGRIMKALRKRIAWEQKRRES